MNEPATDLDSLMHRQRLAWEQRTPVRVEALLAQHPEFGGRHEALLDLINHEIVLRCEFDTPPTRAEYVERFPELANELLVLFEVQDALDGAVSDSSKLETVAEVTAPASAPAPDWPSVPNYTVTEVLGQGGMGVVYMATDHRLKRTVALKMMRGSQAGAEERRRFQSEAEAVAHLDHPGIVHIYEIGESDRQPFFALEFVDGGSLSGLLQGLPQPAISAAHLVEMLARAVHYAHAHGTIHRDLKPANILLQKVGDSASQVGATGYWIHGGSAYLPKIADFGLAKHIQNETDATQTRAIVGTPSYMAPEQAGDFTRRIGPTADVYSLGAILYELITGRPPFRGENVLDTLDQVRTQDPVAPTRLQPKLPRDLETICLKCLRKDPAQRYASAEALADDLGRHLRHEPIRARPTSAWEYLRLWCRRHPARALLVATAFFGTIVGLPLLTYLWLDARASESKYKIQLYESRIDLAHRHWHDNHCDRMQTALESLRPEEFGGSEDLRDFEWYYLWGLLHQNIARVPAEACLAYGPDGALIAAGAKHDIHLWKVADMEAGGASPSARLQGHTANVIALAFSPKGDRLLSAAKDRTARLWDVARQETIKILPHPAEVTSVVFNVDGLMASAGADGLIRLWEADGSLRLVLDEHIGTVNDIAFSADGRRLVSGGHDRSVIVWDVATGDVVHKLKEHVNDVYSVAFASSPPRIAAAGWDSSVRIWEADTGKLLHKYPVLPGIVKRLTFRADGKRLAGSGLDKTIRIWDTDPTRNYPDEPSLFRGHRARIDGLAFSPAGDRLASVSVAPDLTLRLWDPNQTQESRAVDLPTVGINLALHRSRPLAAVAGTDKSLHLWNWRTNQRQVLAGQGGEVGAVAFSSDGSLASAGHDGKIRIWDVDAGKMLRELVGPGSPITALEYHPGGDRLVSAGEDGSVIFWDAPGGRKLRQGPSHRGFVFDLAFSADGRFLASAGADGVSICETETGRETHRHSDPERTPLTVAFSADGERLASGDKLHTIRIWNARSGVLQHRLEGHEASVQAVAFSRNGRRLASGAADGTIKLWSLATGKDLLTLRGHGRDVNGIFFVEDDTMLISLGRTAVQGQIRVWDSTPGRK